MLWEGECCHRGCISCHRAALTRHGRGSVLRSALGSLGGCLWRRKPVRFGVEGGYWLRRPHSSGSNAAHLACLVPPTSRGEFRDGGLVSKADSALLPHTTSLRILTTHA